MSISTPQSGGNSRTTSATPTGSPGKKPATSGPAKPKVPKQAGKGPRKPITPVKVNQGRNWGPIALFVAVGLLALGIIGYGGYYVYKGSQTWEDKANAIDGIINWGQRDPKLIQGAQHKSGKINYTVNPPVGGEHNGAWQRCLGDVYDAPIASEHAIHSMEHGAVWITYRPDLPADQVEALAAKVRGNDYTLMSPFEGLDKPISLQAWGYQLKVDSASDPRIDQFVLALRGNAGPEKGVTCSSGNYTTGTGTTPREIQPQQQQPGG